MTGSRLKSLSGQRGAEAKPIKPLADRMFQHQNGLCCYCEEPMMRGQHTSGVATNPRQATREHLKRQVDGGTNAQGNLRLACYECNTGRGSIDWATYKSYKMGELISYVE